MNPVAYAVIEPALVRTQSFYYPLLIVGMPHLSEMDDTEFWLKASQVMSKQAVQTGPCSDTPQQMAGQE